MSQLQLISSSGCRGGGEMFYSTNSATGSTFIQRPSTSYGDTSSINGSTITNTSSVSSTSESVKVIVRCRPLSDVEVAQGHKSIVSMDVGRGVVEVTNPKDPSQPVKCFTFDAIYDEKSKQLDLYDESFRGLVDSVLNGFNGTIFAYGQTGTGKTFTMEGIANNPELRGVIPNAIEHIFQHIAQSPAYQQYLVRASYLEVYQEEIRDLLDSKDSHRRLELKERPDIGVYVKDLSSFVTKSVEEIEQTISVGQANRSVGCTNMNEHSSRSHAIFILTVECSEKGADGEDHIRVGRLNLVDLAGSERQSKTGAQGDRFREAIKINLSLSALGNVISALVDNKSAYIPYRDSKLTRLLQDSLGGNSKTVMVANIGPASYNYEETMSTLRYANRAKNIQNKPKINEDPKDALLREFQDEINRLKALLEKRGGSATNGAGDKRRRRRRQKMDTSSVNDEQTLPADEGIDELSADDYVREQQLLLEMEREDLLRSTSIVEEEKRRMLVELEERARALEREREAQQVVAAKIRAMQSKLLSGDGNLLQKTSQQQEVLQRKRIELAEQKRREREIAQRLEAQEDSTAEIRQTFANLQQEVEAKTRKLQKFLHKLQQIRSEMRDAAEANGQEREMLATSLSEINKDLKLNFVDYVKGNAIFDADECRWVVDGIPVDSLVFQSSPRTTLKADERERLPSKHLTIEAEKPEMIDSGVESSAGSNGRHMPTHDGVRDEQSVTANINDTVMVSELPLWQNPYLRRPCAQSGFTRPLTNYERALLARSRQRFLQEKSASLYHNHQLNSCCVGGSNATTSTIPYATSASLTLDNRTFRRLMALRHRNFHGSSSEYLMPSITLVDEVLRVCHENLITFEHPIHYVSTVHYGVPGDEVGVGTDKSGELKDAGQLVTSSQNLVIDTSKIPVPRAFSTSSSTVSHSRQRPPSSTIHLSVATRRASSAASIRSSSSAATTIVSSSGSAALNNHLLTSPYFAQAPSPQQQQYSTFRQQHPVAYAPPKNVRARSVLGKEIDASSTVSHRSTVKTFSTSSPPQNSQNFNATTTRIINGTVENGTQQSVRQIPKISRTASSATIYTASMSSGLMRGRPPSSRSINVIATTATPPPTAVGFPTKVAAHHMGIIGAKNTELTIGVGSPATNGVAFPRARGLVTDAAAGGRRYFGVAEYYVRHCHPIASYQHWLQQLVLNYCTCQTDESFVGFTTLDDRRMNSPFLHDVIRTSKPTFCATLCRKPFLFPLNFLPVNVEQAAPSTNPTWFRARSPSASLPPLPFSAVTRSANREKNLIHYNTSESSRKGRYLSQSTSSVTVIDLSATAMTNQAFPFSTTRRRMCRLIDESKTSSDREFLPKTTYENRFINEDPLLVSTHRRRKPSRIPTPTPSMLRSYSESLTRRTLVESIAIASGLETSAATNASTTSFLLADGLNYPLSLDVDGWSSLSTSMNSATHSSVVGSCERLAELDDSDISAMSHSGRTAYRAETGPLADGRAALSRAERCQSATASQRRHIAFYPTRTVLKPLNNMMTTMHRNQSFHEKNAVVTNWRLCNTSRIDDCFSRHQPPLMMKTYFSDNNNNDEWTTNAFEDVIRECDKFSNGFGGRICSLESRIRLWRTRQSRCPLCRYEVSVLHRLQFRGGDGGNRNHRLRLSTCCGRVGKANTAVPRDRCRCVESCGMLETSRNRQSVYGKTGLVKCLMRGLRSEYMDLAIVAAVLAIMLSFLEWLLWSRYNTHQNEWLL